MNNFKNISNEQKIYELSLIWREAEYNFAFWNDFDKSFDWDKEYKIALDRVLKTESLYEYYKELMKFISLLKDGHTDVWFPKEIYESKDYFSCLPIYIEYIDNKYVITNMDITLKEKIPRYSFIKNINEVNIDEYIEKNIYPYIWHEKKDSCADQVIVFLLRGKEGSVEKFVISDGTKDYKVELERKFSLANYAYEKENLKHEDVNTLFSSKSHSIKFTKYSIAIITIDSMMNDELPIEIFNNYKLLNKANGYIIDIRNNSGGNSQNADSVASLFIGNTFNNDFALHPIHIGVYKALGKFNNLNKMSEEEFKTKYKDNKNYEFYEKMYKICNHDFYEDRDHKTFINNVPGKLDGTIVILSSCKTASAAENFINVMRYNSNAVIMGSASYGSTGQPLVFDLESGGGFRICTRKSLALDGSSFINKGFIPDIECSLSIEDYKNSIDSVMNNALSFIRNKISE